MTGSTMEKDPAKWQVLESKYLIKRPWLTARQDHVRLPNGNENDEYYVLEYPDWVNVIAITRDGRFIMERQYRHGLGRTCHEICAGVCEKGEQPVESAKRELLEETGYGNGTWTHLMDMSPNASTNTNLCHCFLATDVERIATPHLEDTEDITVHLMSADEVKRLLLDNEIMQSTMAAPLWKYFAERHLI